MMDKYFVGDNIRKYREEAGMSALTLAKLLGISNVTLSTYENGRTIPSKDCIKRICMIFNIKVEDIFGSDCTLKHDDRQIHMLLDMFDTLTADSKHLLLVRAKELQYIDFEKQNYNDTVVKHKKASSRRKVA